MELDFAIPVDMVKMLQQNLLLMEKLLRGYLGVAIGDLDNELAKSL